MMLPLAAVLLAGAGAILLASQTPFEDGDLPALALLGSVLCLAAALAFAGWWLVRALRRPDREAAPRGQRIAFSVALLVLLAVGGTLGQMDGLLQGFHRPGEGAAGLNSLTGFTVPHHREREMEVAIETWSRYARPGLHGLLEESTPVRPFENDRDAPVTVVAWHVGLDTGLFLPATVVLLGLLIVWVAHTIDRRIVEISFTAGADRARAFRGVATWAVAALLAGAFFDAAENILAFGEAGSTWFRMEEASALAAPDVSGVVAVFLGLATAGKVLGLLASLAYVVVAGVFIVRHAGALEAQWSGLGGAWQSALAVRVQLLVVVVFGAALLIHQQVPDTIRRWADTPAVGVWGVGLTILLAAGTWHGARWSVAYWGSRPVGGSRRLAWTLAVLAAVAALSFGFLSGAGSWSRGLLVPLGMAAALVVLSFPVLRQRSPQLAFPLEEVAAPRPARDRPGLGRTTWPSLLAAGVIAILGLVLVRSSAGHWIYAMMRGTSLALIWPLLVAGVILLVAADVAYWNLKARDRRREPDPAVLGRRWLPALALLASVLAWVLVVRLLRYDLSAAASLGVVGVLSSFLLLASYTGSSVIAVADRLVDRPAPAFRFLGLRRAPILSLALVWVAVASMVPFRGDLHVAVAGGGSGPLRTGVDLEAAFEGWKAANCVLPGPPREVGAATLPAVPMVFVASSGGGIRAAVWTAHVLDQALGQPPAQGGCESPDALRDGPEARSDWVFAMSGVSGGSLGIATYAAQLGLGHPAGPLGEGWVRASLGGDSLSAGFAWMLFVETPWSLLRFGAETDRADVMERSWERAQPELAGDFFALSARDHVPILLFNGTSVESGCRFVVSPLETNGREPSEPSARCLSPQGLVASSSGVLPATVELVDFLCAGQRVPVSTAVMLSARFPVISPSGEVRQCGADSRAGPVPNTFVVDGGYLEGSGAATALELWAGLAPLVAAHNADPASTACIVPFFIQIDNGYDEPAGPRATTEPPQPLVPFSTLRASRLGRTAAARQAAQLVFDRPFASGGLEVWVTAPDGTTEALEHRYAQFATLAHPGEKAPLGWILSQGSFDDLFGEFERSQFQTEDGRAVPRTGSALDRVNDWFGGLSCTVPG